MQNFKEILESVQSLKTNEFRELKQKVRQRLLQDKVSYFIETPFNKLKCPHCNSNNKIRWGMRNKLQRYKCKNCKKTFNSLTKTPLARLRMKDKWLDYSSCVMDELTIRKAAYKCNIHKSTSFRWRHRFLKNSNQIKSKNLAGIIDIKHLYLKESFKGSREIPKRKRRNICIINSIDRNKNIYDLVDIKPNLKNINKKIKIIIRNNSILVTDRNKLYSSFCKTNNLKLKRHIYNLPSKTKVFKVDKAKEYNLNFSFWIDNQFKGVASKYLKNYVSWYRGLNEFSEGIKPLTILLRAKSIEKYKHQPLIRTLDF